MSVPATLLQETADRLGIMETLNRYAKGVDTVDPPLTASCFTRDCRYHMDGEDVLQGQEQLLALLEDRTGIRKRMTGLDSIDSWTHALSNVLVELQGARASVESIVTAYLIGTRGGSTVMFVRCVRYYDEMIRNDDRWLIAERRHSFRWMFQTTPTAYV